MFRVGGGHQHQVGVISSSARSWLSPIPASRCGGNVQNLRDLFDRQSAEVSQFDDACLARIHFRQPFQRVVEGDQFLRLFAAQSYERLVAVRIYVAFRAGVAAGA